MLTSIADAVQILDDSSFTWFGSISTPLPENVRARISGAERRAYLFASLRDKIYRDAYCPGAPRATAPRETELVGRDSRLADELAAANSGQGSWESGWKVVSIEEDAGPRFRTPGVSSGHATSRTLGVESRGLRIWVRTGEYKCRDGEKPNVGDIVDIHLPRGSFDISPGYYSAFSDVPIQNSNPRPLIRLYLAVRPDSAPVAMAAMTGALNSANIPFRFKVLSEGRSYNRCDTAVLYFNSHDSKAAEQPLVEALSRLSTLLNDAVPAFTSRVAPGVGMAEEPDSPESFGENRSGLVAEGIIRMADHGMQGGLKYLLAPWSEAGISLDTPHLNPSSSGDEIATLSEAIARSTSRHFRRIQSIRTASESFPTTEHSSIQGKYSEVAARVSSQLVADAIWHDDRCTWLGAVPASDQRGTPALSHGSIGSSLYDGGAGVGLFLALFGARNSSPEATHTAVAAARQSLRTLTAEPDNGLFTGAAGTVLSAAAIGIAGKDNQLLDLAAASTEHIRRRKGSGADLLSGRAGTILALLCLAQMLNDNSLIADAERLGIELLQDADASSYGYSWANLAGERSPGLTGLSHGASGIGAALVELSQATSKDTYSAAAREAFRYERSWFSNEKGGWPDLRDADRRTARATSHPFLNQWCHGAPGIAISRIRASAVLDDPLIKSEAAIAIRTTAKRTATALSDTNFSFCLCHGLAGNAEVLLESLAGVNAIELPDLDASSRAQNADLVRQIAAQGYSRHFLGDLPWSCGVPVQGVTVPGLMLGTAGIGYHYLRLAQPESVPSILLPLPDDFARRLRELSESDRELTTAPLS